MRIYLQAISLLTLIFLSVLNTTAQTPSINIEIYQINEVENATGDSIEHEITLDFDIDYGGLPLADIRQLEFDLKILDRDKISWYLDKFNLGICHGLSDVTVDTTGFAVDSTAAVLIAFDEGVDTTKACQFRLTATSEVIIEATNSFNRSSASEPDLNNQCSFRQKIDLFVAALNPIFTFADLTNTTMLNDTLIERRWLKTCALPDLDSLQYDTHFEIESYTDTTVVIELLLRYNDKHSFISGSDSLYFATGNIRFLFDTLGLANPRVLPCQECAQYNTNGSAGDLVSFNIISWVTPYAIETKQRLALIEFDVIEDIDTVCAQLIFNELPNFPWTTFINFDEVQLTPAGFDIIVFCPNQFVPPPGSNF